MSDYIIDFTNNTKKPITVLANTLNNDTSLTLFGRDRIDWGSYLNTNLLHLCENFCGEYPPGYGDQLIEGQLWFDSFYDQLKLYTGTDWVAISNVESPNVTNYVTEAILKTKLQNYILLNKSDDRVIDHLLLNNITSTSNNLSLANKQYVLNKLCDCGNEAPPELSNFLKLVGGAKNGAIILPDNTIDSSYASTKKYVDDNIKLTITHNMTEVIIDSAGAINNGITYTESRSSSVTTVLVTGSINLPIGIASCQITVPNALSGNYYVTCSSIGTTFSDTYCTVEPDTKFTITRTTTTAIEKISFTLTGIKA
jgi:hypothetical protein